MLKKLSFSVLFLFLNVAGADDASVIESPDFIDPFYVEKGFNNPAGTNQIVSHNQVFKESKNWSSLLQHEVSPRDAHMFSYALTYLNNGGESGSRGVGDLSLNYRYQLIATKDLALTPRFTVILPTGKYQDSLGQGATGYQVVQTISLSPSTNWMSHWNMGFTLTPGARAATGERATTLSTFFSGAYVYAAHPHINIMIEALGTADEATAGEGEKSRSSSLFIVPGLRGAWEFWGNFKFSPGLGGRLGLGPSERQNDGFLWLTLEAKF